MSDYIIHDGELYHWGVKGMKWGVRRHQNKDGSLTADGKKRARDYRDKEIKTLDKRWNTDRLDKRISKNVDRYNTDPSKRLRNKISADAAEFYLRKGMKAAESSSLRNMSLKDLTKEMQDVGKKRVDNALGVAKGVLMADLIGVGIIKTTKIPNYKTNQRVSVEKQYNIAKSAKYEADMVVNTLRKK